MKKFRLILLIGLIILQSNSFAQSWQVQNSGITQFINGIDCSNSTNAIAVTQFYTLRTADGQNWDVNDLTAAGYMTNVFCLDQNTAYAAGGFNESEIIKTTNGGATWSAMSVPISGKSLKTVQFVNSTTGYVFGMSGAALKYNGSSWQTITSPDATKSNSGCYFSDVNTGYVVGDYEDGTYKPLIFKTTNGGSSWTSYAVSGCPGDGGLAFKIAFSETYPHIGYAVGYYVNTNFYGLILKTTDAGASWSVQTYNSCEQLNSVAFADATTVYAVGSNGTIIKNIVTNTTFGNTATDSWTVETSNTTETLKDICFADANTGWAVGTNGTILKYGEENTLTFEPCPTVGEYCDCNESGTNFNLQIQNFYEEMTIGTASNGCYPICARPNYGSNIPVSTAFIWREVVGATTYTVEIANADGSAITNFPYETGTLVLSATGYEEHREGELIIRKLTQNLDFETEYQIKITAFDASNNILGCATHNFTTYQQTVQNAGCVDEKEAKGHFNNVIAYCNDYHANECNSYYLDCSHYQCTNYVNRYYASVYNVDLGNAGLSGHAKAWYYLTNGYKQNYFSYFENDGNATSTPQIGDIVVWNEDCSHVAIVIGSTPSTVTIIQQNNFENGVPDIIRECSYADNILTDPSDDCIAGWMRLKTLNVDLRETQNNQIALPITYNEIVDIANSTPTFQWTHIPDAEYVLYIKKKRDNNFCFEQIDGVDFPITISASENNNTGYSLGEAGIILEQGEYLCRIGAVIDNNVGTIWSERFYFNINSDNSTILPVIPADELTIIARTTTKKSNKSVIASNIDVSRQNGSAWVLIGTTNQNGNLFAEIYPPLEVGEQLQAQAEGYVTQQITITNEIIQNGIINFNLEEDLTSDFIRNPSMTILEYAPIITQNPVNIQVDAENYINFDIITIDGEEENILYSGTPSTNSTTFTFDYEGIHNIIVRFSNDNHSVEINQYANYQLSTTPENSYNVTVSSTANSIGADVYINNEFVKTITSSNEIFSVPTGTNNFNFSKDGYSTYFETTTDETIINLDLTTTGIENINQLDKLLVFPNPANDLITVSFGKVINENIEITLFDFMGRIIKTVTISGQNEMQINTSELTNGVYYLNIIVDNETAVTKKVIIMK